MERHCYNELMNARQRFLSVMQYAAPDRLPRFEEGIREDVQHTWEQQGLPVGINLSEYFNYDLRQEFEFDLEPHPQPDHWPENETDLDDFQFRLNPDYPDRGTHGFRRCVDAWQERDFPLILRVQRGFFLSMGVEGWSRFNRAIELTKDNPELVSRLLLMQGELSAVLAERFLSKVKVDAALFSEPIGGNHGPLISPTMYQDLVLPGYQPILDVLKKHHVETIIVRTYANPRPLIPLFLSAGMNCLWAVEAPPVEMDYPNLRREFGKDLRLIGGIDTDSLRGDRIAIAKAVTRLEPLVSEGGFIPLLDGRVRDEIRFADYVFYRLKITKLSG